MRWKILLIGVFLILFISNVSADKIEIEVQKGYGIAVPQKEYIKQGEHHLFQFSIYDLSDGTYVDNTTTLCYFDLFNKKGEKMFETEMIYTNQTVKGEWQANVSGGNFSETGTYSYFVQCDENAGNFGGVRSEVIEVVPNGYKPSVAHSSLYIGLLAILALSFFISLYGAIAIRWEDKKNREGELTSINYKKYAKIPLAFLSYFIFLFILAVSEEAAGYIYLNSAATFFNMAFQVGLVFLAPAVLLAGYFVFTRILWDKHAAKVLKRGLSPQGRRGRR